MDFKQSMDYISGFSKSGKTVKDLSRISGLLDLLGEPQKALKFVHIAGTNGKGSVLEYCSNAFIASGYKIGQFTSPYVTTYCDRIRINGENIPEKKTAEICTKVKTAVKSDFYSQFEISLAIALLYFKEEKCDIVFLETGIGGTLDATNIIDAPLASVITSISFDHTGILGNTVEEIAAHKLGIIKKNCPSFISCDNTDEVIKLAQNKASEKNSKLVIPDIKCCHIKKCNIEGSEFTYKNINYTLNMCGKHQIINALTAIEIVEYLRKFFLLSNENTVKALSETIIGSRIEKAGKNPEIIIDGGHNASGINSLANILKHSGIKNAVGIFGMVYGKPIDYGVKSLYGIFKKVYCVDGFADNCIPAEIISKKFENMGVEAIGLHYEKGFGEAYSYAKKHNLLLLACGSLYLASEIKKLFVNTQKHEHTITAI